ncbi:M15 family metallopeptidase [Propionibacteriaceae bacterium G1746]|uniref:M15 family metallopeptidase n=1 Tax=Aestuariimicrobium sp. G57 TaxID=3418485 RepID=UPI003C2735C0
MNIFKKIGAAAVTLGLSATLIASTGVTAQAYTRSQYPGAVMTYVAHPSGWDDSTRVRVSGSSIYCNVPTKVAVSTNGARAVMRAELQPLVQELMRRTEAMGYTLRAADTGGYNCRFIAGTTRPSNHAYGRAIDINWQSNPQSYTFQSNIPPAVVKMWINHGFYWGGHYTYPTKYDTMHFEYVGSFGNITYYYNKLRGTTTTVPTLAVGSTGTRVTNLQRTMNTWFPSYAATPLTVDGVYGAKTESAVKEFQTRVGITADGRFGPVTRDKFHAVTGVWI